MNKKEVVFGYLDTPKDERLPFREFLKETGIMRREFYKLQTEHGLVKKGVLPPLRDVKEVVDAMGEGVRVAQEESNHVSEKYLTEGTARVDKALLKSCDSGNAQALKIYYQLTNRLIEKQETTHKIDGSLIARAVLKAERELGDGGYAMVEVSEELSLLPPELRSDSGQGTTKNT